MTSVEQISLLRERFEKNMKRHQNLVWAEIQARLEEKPDKLEALSKMEATGGEPDVVVLDSEKDEILFIDCSIETPKGRRSLCYDRKALDSRKENKPVSSADELASELGIELLNEEQYKELHRYGDFDAKTSSWLKTPEAVRVLGGAIFGDFRYGRVFVYHNGADSYYAARGFRGLLRL